MTIRQFISLQLPSLCGFTATAATATAYMQHNSFKLLLQEPVQPLRAEYKRIINSLPEVLTEQQVEEVRLPVSQTVHLQHRSCSFDFGCFCHMAKLSVMQLMWALLLHAGTAGTQAGLSVQHCHCEGFQGGLQAVLVCHAEIDPKLGVPGRYTCYNCSLGCILSVWQVAKVTGSPDWHWLFSALSHMSCEACKNDGCTSEVCR